MTRLIAPEQGRNAKRHLYVACQRPRTYVGQQKNANSAYFYRTT